ncbi:MAG: hypothetical protein AB1778_02980 [Candidatus Bipolaricaulota bacterium]
MANTTKRGLEPTRAEERYRRLLAGRNAEDLQALAAKEGLRATTLSWWRWELARRDRLRRGRKSGGPTERRACWKQGRSGTGMPAEGPAFLPVRLAEAPSTSGGAPAGVFAVRLHGGREVCVPPAFDPEDLRRLVAVLEERPW